MTVTLPPPKAAHEARPRALPVEPLTAGRRRVSADGPIPDIVDVWGIDSFPASDAPANW